MALQQQVVDDPIGLLSPPPGWTEIYNASYTLVASEPPGTLVTVDAFEFYGIDLGSLQLLGPGQVVQLAPAGDSILSGLLNGFRANLYGVKIFHTVDSSVAVPLLGTLNLDRYRYVFAHTAVS